MKQEKKYLRRSLVFTSILYCAIFVLFFVSLKFSDAPYIAPPTNKPVDIVHAVTVDQNKVLSEMHHIQAERAARKKAEIAHERHLQYLAHKARASRLQEERQLAHLHAQQLKLAREQKARAIAAQKRLMALHHEQQLAQQKIATMRKQQALAAKAAATKAKALAMQKKQQAAEKLLQQQISAEQNRLASARNKEMLSMIEKYKALILNKIGQQWIMPANVNKALSTQLAIHLAPGGTVLNVALLKTSGNSVLDRSVITAVWKASPLPVPTKSDEFNQFRNFHLTVRPEGLMHG